MDGQTDRHADRQADTQTDKKTDRESNLDFTQDRCEKCIQLNQTISSVRRNVSQFPDLFSHVTQMYSSSSPLVYLQGDHTVVLSEEEGVHQGDPLGPVLFSAVIHPLLSKLPEKISCHHTANVSRLCICSRRTNIGVVICGRI